MLVLSSGFVNHLLPGNIGPNSDDLRTEQVLALGAPLK